MLNWLFYSFYLLGCLLVCGVMSVLSTYKLIVWFLIIFCVVCVTTSLNCVCYVLIDLFVVGLGFNNCVAFGCLLLECLLC